MQKKFKRIVQALSILSLVTVAITLSLITLSTFTGSDTATAQEPAATPPVVFSAEEAATLEAFGMSASDLIYAASGPFDLQVEKTTDVVSVTSGSMVTFNIAITNATTEGTEVPYVIFQDDYPDEMKDATFIFSTSAISDGSETPSWLFTDPIAANQTVMVTVTGILTSAPDVTINNTATAGAFNSSEEMDTTNNTSSASVDIVGYSPLTVLYLPLIFKAPPRVLQYSENFSNDNSGWPDNVDTNICDIDYASNEYRVKVYEDETCWIPGPDAAEYRYGEFQVSARVSDGDGDFDYGLYINGDGGDNYYLFRIKPDDSCGYRLIRKRNGSVTTLRSGGCVSAINRGSATNTLTLKHDRNGDITIYINGDEIYSIDDNNRLTGRGVGLYAEGADDDEVTIRFDNFRVYSVP